MPRQQTFRRTMNTSALLACVIWLGCADDPVSVDGVALFAKGGGGAGVSVDATNPTTANQGTVGLDVHVFGSGFEPGSDVTFLLDRKATGDISTNSTTFVDSTEVIANIAVAATAEPELFDVRLETPRGRKGIGIELLQVIGTHCSVEFDLVIDESKRLHSDDRGKYENGVDKVIVGTGTQGDGFRFATPGKGNKKNVARRVKFDFTGTLWEVLADSADLKATDFRFSNQDPGLNLCTMGMGTPISDTVAVNLPFDSPSWDGASGGLKYGGTTYLGEPCGSPQARVTRTSDTTWVMSGTTACIATGGSILDHNVAMPFAFTLTAQGPVP